LISCVVFADGTYEGDAGAAASVLAPKLGEKIQLTRILTLLRSETSAERAALSQAVDRLPVEISSDDFDRFLKGFPELSSYDKDYARAGAQVAAAGIQADFKKNFGTGATIPPDVLADAVKAAILKCEKLIQSLPL
jgi:hypothetical protein